MRVIGSVRWSPLTARVPRFAWGCAWFGIFRKPRRVASSRLASQDHFARSRSLPIGPGFLARMSSHCREPMHSPHYHSPADRPLGCTSLSRIRSPATTPPQPDTVPLPDLSPFQEVAADYQTVGLSLKAHPMSFLRDQLTARQVTRASDLKHCRDGTASRSPVWSCFASAQPQPKA